MITDKDIARINELYHKSKSLGLTEVEAAEQKKLRADYIAAIRGNIRAQLNNIDVIDENGNVENLGEKHRAKLKNNDK